MSSLEIQVVLPETLVREAEDNGLLISQAIEVLIREELQRRRVSRLFDAADRLAALNMPMTEADVAAEIDAMRGERRNVHADRG